MVLKPKDKEQYTKELVGVFQKAAGNKKLLEDFLVDVLTPGEYEELGVRWQIVKRLHEGVPQRKIAKDLGVGIATVTRGSRELADPNGGFKKVLEKLSKK